VRKQLARPTQPGHSSVGRRNEFLCVHFAYANSYVPNAIHKTSLRTKNRKFVREYTHAVSCRTTENFR